MNFFIFKRIFLIPIYILTNFIRMYIKTKIRFVECGSDLLFSKYRSTFGIVGFRNYSTFSIGGGSTGVTGVSVFGISGFSSFGFGALRSGSWNQSL